MALTKRKLAKFLVRHIGVGVSISGILGIRMSDLESAPGAKALIWISITNSVERKVDDG